MISWEKPGILIRGSTSYATTLLINILIITFLSVLATVSTLISDGAIQGELALSDNTTVWLTTLNLLGVNTIVPASNWFAERFGFKTMLMFGMVLFTLASFLAGIATNFPLLGAARLLEGIGSGFIFPVGLSLLTQNLSPKFLPLALILYIGSAFGAGFAIGLPLSGYLTQFYSWRYVFFLTAIMGLITILVCRFFQDDTERKKTSKFDSLGYGCFVIFFSSFLIALTYGPMLSTSEGWRSPSIIGGFCLAFVSLVATIYIETSRKNPIIPVELFKYPIYTVTCVAMFILGMSVFASVGTMIQYMIQALYYERFVSGKLGIIYGVSLAVCSVLANILIKKIPVPILTFIGLCFLVFSYFLNNILDWQTGPRQILLILLLRGVGVGLALGPATILALKSVPKELENKAATLLTFFRQVGGTYGGTLVSILVIKRTIFHLARFGEQAQTELPGFQVTFRKLFSHYKSTFFDDGTQSAALAKATIGQNIENQAFIQAMNDAMIVLGYITLTIALFLVALNIRNFLLSRTQKESKIST